MVLTTNLKKRILFYKKLRELFKNGHLFLSIFFFSAELFSRNFNIFLLILKYTKYTFVIQSITINDLNKKKYNK